MERFIIQMWDKLYLPIQTFVLRLLVAFLIYWIGKVTIRLILNFYIKFTNKYSDVIDKNFQSFLESLIKISLKMILFLLILGVLGVKTDIFVALIGSLGVGVGFALRDIITSVLNSIVLLSYKPFKIGDHIKINGLEGIVIDINIFSIQLRSFDNEEIFISNKNLNNDSITNYTSNQYRRISFSIQLYSRENLEKTSIDSLKEDIRTILHKHSKIVLHQESVLRIDSIDKKSIVLFIGVWVYTVDFYTVRSEILEMLKQELSEYYFSTKEQENSMMIYDSNFLYQEKNPQK